MFSNILKLASKYNLLCLAGLREDMAERIMFSTLPSTVSKEQVSSTEGVVDYNALKWAAEGRFNIIKYGLLACIDELEHISSRRDNPLAKAKSLFDSKQYKQCATFCASKFRTGTWGNEFGGEAWAKIAITLLHIIELDEQLKAAKESHNVDEEINLMKKIIVELNIFDGLSHNTASVMTSLLNEENKIEHPEWNLNELDYESDEYGNVAQLIQEKRESVQRLMDAKELENPKAVFTEIKNYLAEPYKYHDYTPKLKSNILQQDNYEELIKIKIKKIIREFLPKINEKISSLLLFYKYDDDKINAKELDEYKNKTYVVLYNIVQMLDQITDVCSSSTISFEEDIRRYLGLFKLIQNNIPVFYLKLSLENIKNIKNAIVNVSKSLDEFVRKYG